MEKREVPRHKCFLRAFVYFEGRSTAVDCVVRDISSLGARLAFVSTAYIPDTFELTFDSAHTLRPCRVAWRTDTQIGVEFQGTTFRPAA